MARKVGDRNYTPQVVRIINERDRGIRRRDRAIERLKAQVAYEKAARRKLAARMRMMQAEWRERIAKLTEALRASKANHKAEFVTQRRPARSSVAHVASDATSGPRPLVRDLRKPKVVLGRVLTRSSVVSRFPRLTDPRIA